MRYFRSKGDGPESRTCLVSPSTTPKSLVSKVAIEMPRTYKCTSQKIDSSGGAVTVYWSTRSDLRSCAGILFLAPWCDADLGLS